MRTERKVPNIFCPLKSVIITIVTISKLICEDGSFITDPKGILNEEKDFYKKLYSTRNSFETCSNQIIQDFLPEISDIPKLNQEAKQSCEGQLKRRKCCLLLSRQRMDVHQEQMVFL